MFFICGTAHVEYDCMCANGWPNFDDNTVSAIITFLFVCKYSQISVKPRVNTLIISLYDEDFTCREILQCF